MTPPGRLPYQPLERLMRVAYDRPDFAAGLHSGQRGEWNGLWRQPTDLAGHGLWTDLSAALMADTTRRQIMRWKTEGLTVRAADAAAVRLGLHPLEVWGLAWPIAEIATLIYRWKPRTAAHQRTPNAVIADAACRLAAANERARARRAVAEIVAHTRTPIIAGGCNSELGVAA